MLNFKSVFYNNPLLKKKIVYNSYLIDDIEFVYKIEEDCYILVRFKNGTFQRLDFDSNWGIDGIVVEEHIGTWYVIDTQITDGVLYLLLEHEWYGDEAPCVIIDIDGNVILEDVYNGFDDLDEYLCS